MLAIRYGLLILRLVTLIYYMYSYQKKIQFSCLLNTFWVGTNGCTCTNGCTVSEGTEILSNSYQIIVEFKIEKRSSCYLHYLFVPRSLDYMYYYLCYVQVQHGTDVCVHRTLKEVSSAFKYILHGLSNIHKYLQLNDLIPIEGSCAKSITKTWIYHNTHLFALIIWLLSILSLFYLKIISLLFFFPDTH